MVNPGPTVQRARLGRELRLLREAVGLDQAQAAAALEKAGQTTISKIERGRRRVTISELNALLDLYGVTDSATRARLVELARSGAQGGSWLEPYTSVMSRRHRDYARFEADATRISSWEPVLVPGLLQTEAYARAMLRGAVREISDEELEARVEIRMRRQAEVAKHLPRMWVIMDVCVLRRIVGDHTVMIEQLRRLLGVATEPNTTIQIMPLSQGAHPGVGSLTILGFDDEEPERVYTETVAGDLYLQGEQADRATLAYDHLRASALDADASVAEMRKALRELEREA